MSAMPIFCKLPSKISFPWTEFLEVWYVASGTWAIRHYSHDIILVFILVTVSNRIIRINILLLETSASFSGTPKGVFGDYADCEISGQPASAQFVVDFPMPSQICPASEVYDYDLNFFFFSGTE